MAEYGSVDLPVAASEPALPQRTDRKKCSSALVYGTLLSLALAGVALKGTPGGGFHSKKKAQLSAASPGGAADSPPPRQFAAELPGQDDDKAHDDAVNASANGWVVHDIDLRAHEDVREFLRSQGINASTSEETMLDYVPRLEVRACGASDTRPRPSIQTQRKKWKHLFSSRHQPSKPWRPRLRLRAATTTTAAATLACEDATAQGPRRRRVRRDAGGERLRLVLPHEQRRVLRVGAACRRLPRRHDARGRRRRRAADNRDAHDRHRRQRDQHDAQQVQPLVRASSATPRDRPIAARSRRGGGCAASRSMLRSRRAPRAPSLAPPRAPRAPPSRSRVSRSFRLRAGSVRFSLAPPPHRDG